jgi:hypothetical protein
MTQSSPPPPRTPPEESPPDRKTDLAPDDRPGRGLSFLLLFAILYGAFLALNLADPKILSQTTIPISRTSEISLHGITAGLFLGAGVILLGWFLCWVYLRTGGRPRT